MLAGYNNRRKSSNLRPLTAAYFSSPREMPMIQRFLKLDTLSFASLAIFAAYVATVILL